MNHKARKVAIVLGALLAALALLTYVAHLQSKDPVKQYKDELVASGEKMRVEELIPPPVSPDVNGAAIFLDPILSRRFPSAVVETNAPPLMRVILPGRAWISWRQPEICYYDVTNSWDDLAGALEERRAVLDVLHQLIDRPRLDFGVDYNETSLRQPHLSQLKEATLLLSAAAACDLHYTNTASAVAHARAILAIIKGWSDERSLISQLVRMSIATISFSVNWELLQSDALTDEQLAALQADWTGMEFLKATENTLMMERAMGQRLVSDMRSSTSPFSMVVGSPRSSVATPSGGWSGFSQHVWRKTRLRTKETLWRVVWSYTDEMRTLMAYQSALDAIRRVQTNAAFQPAIDEHQRELAALGMSGGADTDVWLATDEADVDPRWIFSGSMAYIGKYLERVRRIEVMKQLAIGAIAVRRYEMKHGTPPPNLAALVPDFLPEVPRDPIDGEPLRYRLNPDGTFVLYSIGEDAVDDGGDPAPPASGKSLWWDRGRDYCWPMPATESEVEEFWQR